MKNKAKEMQVQKDSKLKEWLVDYVGNKKNPEDENVTVEMIVGVVADEFPEFVMALAEENWIRGYQQGLDDVEYGMKQKAKEDDKQTKDS